MLAGVVRFSKASKVRNVGKVIKASKNSEVCKVSKLSMVRKVRKVSKISKVSIVSRIVNVHCAGATFTMEGECFPPWVGTLDCTLKRFNVRAYSTFSLV